MANNTDFFDGVITRELGSSDRSRIRVLDFGCGAGQLVKSLLALGYDAYGCDLGVDWPQAEGEWHASIPERTWTDDIRSHLKPIQSVPYRLPFEAGTFDVVISDQVLEHANNKPEAFEEIARVLKAGGLGIHRFPSKWYLPLEPHIYVPFVSWMWPTVPYWWLSLWAVAGVRNEYQKGMKWQEVAASNRDYCKNRLCYWSERKFRSSFLQHFGDYRNFAYSYVKLSDSRKLKIMRMALGTWLTGQLLFTFRGMHIGHQNLRQSHAAPTAS